MTARDSKSVDNADQHLRGYAFSYPQVRAARDSKSVEQ